MSASVNALKLFVLGYLLVTLIFVLFLQAEILIPLLVITTLLVTMLLLIILLDKLNKNLQLTFLLAVIITIFLFSIKFGERFELSKFIFFNSQVIIAQFSIDDNSTKEWNWFEKDKQCDNFCIFFVETSYSKLDFTTKQMCSIESAARSNGNASVNVFSVRSKLNFTLFQDNLNVYRLREELLFIDTPLERWWLSKRYSRSRYAYAHISDAVRLALLWKYGGVYSDLDTITLKNFQNLLDQSGVGYLYEGTDSVGNGLLIFKSHSPFLNYAMARFETNYNPYLWGENGPLLILNSLKSYCKYENIFLRLKRDKCADLVIYPEDYFYPIRYYKNEFKLIFKKSDDKNNDHLVMNKLNSSYSIHLYGSLSKNLRAKPNDNSLYDKLARTYCPRTYEYVKTNALYFE